MKRPHLQRRTLTLLAVLLPIAAAFAYVIQRAGPLKPAAVATTAVDEKIIPTFRRIYRIRDRATHEEAGEGRGFV